MNMIQKKAFIQDVLEYIREQRVFDLVSFNRNNDVPEIVISNMGKIQKSADGIVFLEKDCFGIWQKVPFLKAPFRILDNDGIPYADSQEFQNDEMMISWIHDSVHETIRHIVEQLIKDRGVEKSFEFFLIKEIAAEVLNSDAFADQQLLSKNFQECKEKIMSFHQAIKESLLDDALNKCMADLRSEVTLFEFTFTLPNKQKFLQYGKNWINILPTLAKAQAECFLLSQKGCFADSCQDWVEDAGESTEWNKTVPVHLQNYIKHIPVNSLRAIIGNNTSHIIAIMQLANIDPHTETPFFSYLGKSMNAMEIDSSQYRIYADVVAQIFEYVEDCAKKGYNSILSVCSSVNLMQSLLDIYKSKEDDKALKSSMAIKAIKAYLAGWISDEFNNLVANNRVDYYQLNAQAERDFVAILGKPDDTKQFQLYEKCALLVGDTENGLIENDDLDWWFIHVDDYRVLVSLVEDAPVGSDLCNMYSNKTLNADEITAIHGVVRNIQKKRAGKNTI